MTTRDTTRLLQRVQGGDEAASDELLELVYDQLHALARGQMAREREGHTLNATALVHEAWVRLVDPVADGLDDRGHFFRLASRAMRRVLVDHARSRKAQKRGDGREDSALDGALDSMVALYEDEHVDLLALHDALELLGERDPVLVQVVELRYFGGLSEVDAARELGVSVRTLARHWQAARAFLYQRLRSDPGD